MSKELAEHLIEENLAVKRPFLDLGFCGLTHLPASIHKVAAHLTSLSCGAGYLNATNTYQLSKIKEIEI